MKKSIAIVGGLAIVIAVFAVLTWPRWLPVNAPPLFEREAREYLLARGIAAELVRKLEERKSLSENDLARLATFSNVSVLHLVANNPGASPALLRRLSSNASKEVLWGLASNRNAPLELVLPLRTIGKYSTMNGYIARNAAVPEQILREMYANNEAGHFDFAINESLPVDLMTELLAKDDSVRLGLALNRNIPNPICLKLRNDESEIVRRNVRKPCLPADRK